MVVGRHAHRPTEGNRTPASLRRQQLSGQLAWQPGIWSFAAARAVECVDSKNEKPSRIHGPGAGPSRQAGRLRSRELLTSLSPGDWPATGHQVPHGCTVASQLGSTLASPFSFNML